MGWTDDQKDLRINLLGWLATKTDEQIQQEAVEMVSALETVAHTRNMTQMGEDIMTDVVRLCTIVISRVEDIMTTSNKEEESTGLETKQQEYEHDIDTKIFNHLSPVAKEEQQNSLGEQGHCYQQDQGHAQQDQGGLQGEDNQGAHHHQQHPHGEGQQHHLQPDGSHRGGDKAVTPACTLRMPGSILLASQGGTCPRTIISNPDTNTLKLEVEGGPPAWSRTTADRGQAG
jgi:hypothetical protein